MVIVMEYAAGGTLYDLLETRRREGQHLEEEELAHLFAQIVLAMYYVHQNQILHRDLKSENIFLTRSLDHVKIGDFGISKILSSKSSQPSTPLGQGSSSGVFLHWSRGRDLL